MSIKVALSNDCHAMVMSMRKDDKEVPSNVVLRGMEAIARTGTLCREMEQLRDGLRRAESHGIVLERQLKDAQATIRKLQLSNMKETMIGSRSCIAGQGPSGSRAYDPDRDGDWSPESM